MKATFSWQGVELQSVAYQTLLKIEEQKKVDIGSTSYILHHQAWGQVNNHNNHRGVFFKSIYNTFVL